MNRDSRQRGAALITALLIVALAVSAAAAVASRHQLDIRRTSNLFEADQANAYTLGAEIWARVRLRKDLDEGETDHLKEDWATRIPPLPVPGGEVSGFIEDLQGRFNINNLLREGQVSEPDLAVFERLLTYLDIDRVVAIAVLDWMDADIDARSLDGAEDSYYLGLERPYRVANQPLVSISELRLVKGMTAEAYDRLAPHVAALPETTKINVNTASRAVLMALVEDLTEVDAQTLIDDRGEEGYENTEAFAEHPVLKDATFEKGLIDVKSTYFLVHSQSHVGAGRARMYSLVQRGEKGEMRTLSRVRGIE